MTFTIRKICCGIILLEMLIQGLYYSTHATVFDLIGRAQSCFCFSGHLWISELIHTASYGIVCLDLIMKSKLLLFKTRRFVAFFGWFLFPTYAIFIFFCYFFILILCYTSLPCSNCTVQYLQYEDWEN